MKNIQLYIGQEEVELSLTPDLLYTYQITDLSNPTAVKNSFSKTLTIEGTQRNNNVFGQYWNLERVQDGGGRLGNGTRFNASKKMPFTLYINDDIYEEGYVKLDEVRRNGTGIEYDITLYGGLGDFFYNLTYSEGDDGEKMKLSGLDYYTGGSDELTFTANIDTVKTAWENIGSGKWGHINFAPAYNGLPDDFDSGKAVMNLSGTSLVSSKTEDGTKYGTTNNWVLAELPAEMTEWEVRDMRSYLQRPVIRMKSIINACCNPDKNGGYDVVLDSDFFNSENPYWEDTWLTLPMVSSLEYVNQQQVLEDSELIAGAVTGLTDQYMYQPIMFEMGEFSESLSSLSLWGTVKIDTSIDRSTSFIWFWNKNGDSAHPNWIREGSLFCQLLAYNGDEVVGASAAYNLTTPIRHNGKLYYGNNDDYGDGNKFSSVLGKPIYNVLGWFGSEGFHYEDGGVVQLNFSISNVNSSITGLKMLYYWGADSKKKSKTGVNWLYDKTKDVSWADMSVSSHEVPMDEITFNIEGCNFKAVLGESMGKTGTIVTKDLLLNTESTPCDYLLSYCKMFGLYFLKDVYSNTISILTRDNFYKKSEIVDLDKYIDRDSEITITPLTFDTKWYEFSNENEESAFYELYSTSHGKLYGSQVVNTGYEFNAEKKDLLEDICIKGAVEGLEKSKYFTAFSNDNKLRPWMSQGMKYTLVSTAGDTIELMGNTKNMGTPSGINSDSALKYFDFCPKVQFHDSDNNAVDGQDVLLFYNGTKSTVEGRSNPVYYWLTDDNKYMTLLNEGTPCWIFTTSENDKDGDRVAYRITDMPVFERYYTKDESTTIMKSLDFGSPREIYVPTYTHPEDCTIYENFWKSYINDLYDVDSRIMRCKVRLEDKPNPGWLQPFYWFDNSIWRLNMIEDWNVADDSTTTMEFVKVKDIESYTNVKQTNISTITITASQYNIGYEGGDITVTVSRSDGGKWDVVFDDALGMPRQTKYGTYSFTVSIPRNDDEYVKSYKITAYGEYAVSIWIVQSYLGELKLYLEPEDLIIPASGGTFLIRCDWVNQGNNYVQNIDYNEGEEYLQFTYDTKTYADEGYVALTFGENTTKTVLSNYAQFETSPEYVSASVGLDQLPYEIGFEPSGGTSTITLQYVSGATVVKCPSWADVTDNGDGTYTVTVQRNLYDTEQTGEIVLAKSNVVTKGDGDTQLMQASFIITQGAGSGIVGTGVSPESLTFENSGGTQYLNVNLSGEWKVVARPNWITLNQSSGTTAGIVGVSAYAYSGEDVRTGDLVIYDGTNTYVITCTQNGSSTSGNMTLSPSELYASNSGGSYEVTVTYVNKGDDFVTLYCDDPRVTFTDIAWNGEVGTTMVTFADNRTGTTEVNTVINFDGGNADAVLPIRQGMGEEVLTVSSDNVVFPYSGGTVVIDVESNVAWKVRSDE